jgi:hypothetical protein
MAGRPWSRTDCEARHASIDATVYPPKTRKPRIALQFNNASHGILLPFWLTSSVRNAVDKQALSIKKINQKAQHERSRLAADAQAES